MGILGSFAQGRQDTLPPTNDIFLPTVTHVVAIWNGSFASTPAAYARLFCAPGFLALSLSKTPKYPNPVIALT
jgi:hypothetical protein